MPNQAIKQVFEEIKAHYKAEILKAKDDESLSNAEKVARIKELTAEAKTSINNKKKELIVAIEEEAHKKELEHIAEIEREIESM